MDKHENRDIGLEEDGRQVPFSTAAAGLSRSPLDESIVTACQPHFRRFAASLLLDDLPRRSDSQTSDQTLEEGIYILLK
jgi:hypothetical protein